MAADPPSRISQVATAQGLPPEEQVQRYATAVRGYLVALLRKWQVRDAEDVASEVSVEIAERFHKGGLLGWQGRGRFRDWLKKATRNQAISYLRAQTARWRRERLVGPLPEASQEFEETAPDEWETEYFRTDLLANALRALKAYEEQHPAQVYHTVVRLLGEEGLAGQEKVTSEELARRLTEATRRPPDRPYTAENFRKLKEKALRRFAEVLLEELRRTLGNPGPGVLEEELHTLGLFPYVGRFLPADWRTRGEFSPEAP
jgi:DNA-directed RNA polymerase specialized sigma24 family protein